MTSKHGRLSFVLAVRLLKKSGRWQEGQATQ